MDDSKKRNVTWALKGLSGGLLSLGSWDKCRKTSRECCDEPHKRRWWLGSVLSPCSGEKYSDSGHRLKLALTEFAHGLAIW